MGPYKLFWYCRRNYPPTTALPDLMIPVPYYIIYAPYLRYTANFSQEVIREGDHGKKQPTVFQINIHFLRIIFLFRVIIKKLLFFIRWCGYLPPMPLKITEEIALPNLFST